jgi:UDP-glucose:(heptosyl)LPS alpha-1,3-glucosyltransferase
MRLGIMRLKYEQGGGAEQTLLLLARGLLARGHDVHALVSAWEGERPRGLRVRLITNRGWGAARLKSFAQHAVELIRGLRLDTCLSLERAPGCPVFRAGDGCHAAWLEHRSPYESLLKRLSFQFNPLHRTHLDMEQRTLTSPKLVRVIANSRLVAGEIMHHYGVAEDKISVVYNGVDEQMLWLAHSGEVRRRARQELGLTAGQPVLLFLGSGFERKGLAFAMKALASLPEAVLLVAGRDCVGPYEHLAQRLGVGRRVRFLGRRGDAPRLLTAADAMVLPTIYDPCSNACLESLYVGTPVVTTMANGACELIREGVNGALVPEPADQRSLTAACQRALVLRRPVPHQVSSQEQWLANIEAEMAAAAGAAQ